MANSRYCARCVGWSCRTRMAHRRVKHGVGKGVGWAAYVTFVWAWACACAGWAVKGGAAALDARDVVEVREDGSSWRSSLLLVSLLDGDVHALEAGTGRHVWKVGSGRPLVSTSHPLGTRPGPGGGASSSSSPSSSTWDAGDGDRVFPGLDGSLFVQRGGEDEAWLKGGESGVAGGGTRAEGALGKIFRLGVTFRELVDGSPSVTGEGDSLVLGRRATSVLAVDRWTGEVLREYDDVASAMRGSASSVAASCEDDDSGSCVGEGEAKGRDREGKGGAFAPLPSGGAIYVMRTDLTLSAIDLASGSERWNMTTGELSLLQAGGEVGVASQVDGLDTGEKHTYSTRADAGEVGEGEGGKGVGGAEWWRERVRILSGSHIGVDVGDTGGGGGGWTMELPSILVSIQVLHGDGTLEMIMSHAVPVQGGQGKVFVGTHGGHLFGISSPALAGLSDPAEFRHSFPGVIMVSEGASQLALAPGGEGDWGCVAGLSEGATMQTLAAASSTHGGAASGDALPLALAGPLLSDLSLSAVVITLALTIISSTVAAAFLFVWLVGRHRGDGTRGATTLVSPFVEDDSEDVRSVANPERRGRDEVAKAGDEAMSAPPHHRAGDGAVRVGKITVDLGNVLGHGCHGTVVFEGRMDDGRRVAVKRMLKHFVDAASQEIRLLIASDDHPGVVRYFAREEDEEFVYVALELCVVTLADLVGSPVNVEVGDCLSMPSHTTHSQTPRVSTVSRATLLKEMCAGVAHLHEKHIVHRDIKPQNVLVGVKGEAKISDMGLGKRLNMDQSSFENHTDRGGGSAGWQAPEQLRHGDGTGQGSRLTRKVDVFALGCVLHYGLTGTHPFGEPRERESNIMRLALEVVQDRGGSDGGANVVGESPVLLNKGTCAEALSSLGKRVPEAAHLLGVMLHPDPAVRPEARCVTGHPLFWDIPKKLALLLDVSDKLEKEAPESRLVRRLEQIVGGRLLRPLIQSGVGWDSLLCQDLVQELQGKLQRRSYQKDSARDLLRVIRNKHNHFREMPADLRERMGPVPEGYYRYFATRFPGLLMAVYDYACDALHDDEFVAAKFLPSPRTVAVFRRRVGEELAQHANLVSPDHNVSPWRSSQSSALVDRPRSAWENGNRASWSNKAWGGAKSRRDTPEDEGDDGLVLGGVLPAHISDPQHGQPKATKLPGTSSISSGRGSTQPSAGAYRPPARRGIPPS